LVLFNALMNAWIMWIMFAFVVLLHNI
jgi:hypothetical protein